MIINIKNNYNKIIESREFNDIKEYEISPLSSIVYNFLKEKNNGSSSLSYELVLDILTYFEDKLSSGNGTISFICYSEFLNFCYKLITDKNINIDDKINYFNLLAKFNRFSCFSAYRVVYFTEPINMSDEEINSITEFIINIKKISNLTLFLTQSLSDYTNIDFFDTLIYRINNKKAKEKLINLLIKNLFTTRNLKITKNINECCSNKISIKNLEYLKSYIFKNKKIKKFELDFLYCSASACYYFKEKDDIKIRINKYVTSVFKKFLELSIYDYRLRDLCYDFEDDLDFSIMDKEICNNLFSQEFLKKHNLLDEEDTKYYEKYKSLMFRVSLKNDISWLFRIINVMEEDFKKYFMKKFASFLVDKFMDRTVTTNDLYRAIYQFNEIEYDEDTMFNFFCNIWSSLEKYKNNINIKNQIEKLFNLKENRIYNILIEAGAKTVKDKNIKKLIVKDLI